MIAVGKPAFEADWGLKDASVCSGNENCFQLGNPSQARIGTNAGSFFGNLKGATTAVQAGCSVYLYQDAGAWHYVNGGCAQTTGYLPGPQDRVFVTGCANFRGTPSLSATVLGCLGNGTIVDVDSAPVYQDGHIWWHLASRGWMAHDFLVAPKNCHC